MNPVRQNISGNVDPSNEVLARADMIQYHTPNQSRDSHLALRCRTPGDTVRIPLTPGVQGPAELNEYNNVGPDGTGAVLLQVKGGNQYGIARGILIDFKRGTYLGVYGDLDHEIEIKIDEKMEIPRSGMARTSEVDTALFFQGESGYYTGSRDLASVREAEDSPFAALLEITEHIAKGSDPAFIKTSIGNMQEARGFTRTP